MSAAMTTERDDEIGLVTAAYDAFAPFYDMLTRDADHDWWWSALLPLAEAAGLPGTRVLDVACGTGRSLAPLVACGWSVMGVDASAGMLAQARARLGPAVPLSEGDMRELPRLGGFDLVCALNDAVNYLLGERQLADAFAGFRRNLVPGGVVVFDVSTLATFRDPAVLVQQDPGRVVLVDHDAGPTLPPGALVRSEFIVMEQRDGFLWNCRRNPHFQRHHPDAEIRRALTTADLELVATYGQTGKTITPGADESTDERVVYVARAATRRR